MLKIVSIVMMFTVTSIYTIHFTTGTGTDATFGSYQGKKILLVNIATGSGRMSQLAGLQQLYTQYRDSLVIVAFPSNSFGNEPLSDSLIGVECRESWGVTFPVAAKSSVKGATAQATYAWLANATANGLTSATVDDDFYKFLLDRNGHLIGAFAPDVRASDTVLLNAITNHE